MTKLNTSAKIRFSKDSYGYYSREDLELLEPNELLELLIEETSYQETMNVVRLTSMDELSE